MKLIVLRFVKLRSPIFFLNAVAIIYPLKRCVIKVLPFSSDKLVKLRANRAPKWRDDSTVRRTETLACKSLVTNWNISQPEIREEDWMQVKRKTKT